MFWKGNHEGTRTKIKKTTKFHEVHEEERSDVSERCASGTETVRKRHRRFTQGGLRDRNGLAVVMRGGKGFIVYCVVAGLRENPNLMKDNCISMAKKKSTKTNNGANLGFEETLWAAADKLRSNMDASYLLST